MSHVKIRIPSIAILACAAVAALAAMSIVISHSSSVDITRARLERDIAPAFSHQYVQQQRLLGVRAAPLEVAANCRKGGPTVTDQGPGKDWICTITYEGSVPGTSRYEVNARTEACYTATDPKLTTNHQFVREQSSGSDVDNPLYQFDGCFNVA